MIGAEIEAQVASCFDLFDNYRHGKLSTATHYLLAEVGQWAIQQYDRPIADATKEEIAHAIDSRYPQVGLRPHDSKLKRLKTFHNAVVCEANIIAHSTRKKPKSTLDEMSERRVKGGELNAWLRSL